MYDHPSEMRFQLPEEALEIQRTVAALSERHQDPLEARILAGGTVARADFRPGREAAKAAGLWGLGLPAEYGGADLPL
ncbi:MAG: acyl-CoA dehydrogenase family protein, partial [Albimonas sp.]|uniref:acyl-CoA dehydrogenase family protein n=1 Tax=Albimonas sp. TaxID=1872425 RepID=UPI0040573767